MSGLQNKNLIFYSMYPQDTVSRQCLEALDKVPALNKQFIRICVHHPQDCSQPPIINLPNKIYQFINRIPILAIAGFQEPIFAESALSWIQETSLKAEDVVAASNIHGGGVADNCSSIDQSAMGGNSLFDTEYNITFKDGKGEFNRGFANIDEASQARIVTFEDSGDKKAAADEVKRRLDEMKMNRDVDLPRAPPRMGGMAGTGHSSGPMMPGGGMPMMPGGGMPMMPGNMPRMPMMPGNMPRMPMMPGNMPRMPMMPGNGHGMQAGARSSNW